MITSWENECKVSADSNLFEICRTAAAFMKLIMTAHTSWHSSEAASGGHWCKPRTDPNSFGFAKAQPNDGRSHQQKQGEERCQPFPLLTLKKAPK